VLDAHTLPLHIHNPTLIPADFKLFIETEDSLFSVQPREMHLEAGGSTVAEVKVRRRK
jgi:hydrocephalus-inducing protein